jgi:hypothetical protein
MTKVKTTEDLYTSITSDPIFTPSLKSQIQSVQKHQDLTEKFVKKVINGVHKNAILQGPPGLGKSFSVQTALMTAGLIDGTDYRIVKGHITPLQLYAALYMYRRPGQILVLDDCDDVFGSELGIGLVKTATDPDNRTITFDSTRVPVINGTEVREFVFNGTLIVCSNVALSSGRQSRRNQHMAAILSRTTTWPLGWNTRELKFAQVFNMVVNNDYLSNSARTKISDSQKAELLTFLLENLNDVANLDLRLPQKIAAEMVADSINWKESCVPFLKV